MKNENKSKLTFLHSPSFSSSTSLLRLLPHSPHCMIQVNRKWDLHNSLCCSFILTFFSCSNMRSWTWDTILPKLILHGFHGQHGFCNSSKTAPIWVCTTRSIHQEWTVPAQTPHGWQFLPALPPWAPLWAATWKSTPLWYPWASGRHPAPPGSSPQGSFCSVPATFSHLQLHWPWCLQGCFSHIFLSHSWCTELFYSFFKHVITGSDVCCGGSLLETDETDCFWSVLTDASTAGPLLAKPCHVNPIHLLNYNLLQISR